MYKIYVYELYSILFFYVNNNHNQPRYKSLVWVCSVNLLVTEEDSLLFPAHMLQQGQQMVATPVKKTFSLPFLFIISSWNVEYLNNK